MAPGRAGRPVPLEESQETADEAQLSADDPFARGHEEATPEAIVSLNRKGQPSADWHVRVVPNKYPALLNVAVEKATQTSSLFPCDAVVGEHELLIECPDYRQCWSEFDVEEIELVLKLYQQRLREQRQTGRWTHAVVFKNCGLAAGASLPHAHSQLMFSNGKMPTRLQNVFLRLQETPELWSRYLQAEQEQRLRIFHQTDELLAFCPYASRFQYEHWMMPYSQEPHFEYASENAIAQVANVLKATVTKLRSLAQPLAYNVVVITAPWDMEIPQDFRWSVQIYPRLSGLAGFETGTEDAVNVILPEFAAQRLRESCSGVLDR